MVRQPLLAEGRSPSCGAAHPAGLTFPGLLPGPAGSPGALHVLAPAHTRAGRAGEVEVFVGDDLVRAGVPGGGGVERVAEQVRRAGVDARDPRGGALPPLRAAPPGTPVRAVLAGRAALHGA